MKSLTRYGLLVLPLVLAFVTLGAWVAHPLFTPAVALATMPERSAFIQAVGLPLVRGQPSSGQMTELEVRDVVPLQDLGTHAVMLVSKDGQQVLPIFVSEEAAVSIAFRLAEREPPHPLAADLLDGVVTSLGGSVKEIRIDDIQGEVFTGRVFIQQGRKNLELNARPSDAICMALAGDAKIYASQKVMAEGSISRNEIDELRRSMPPGVGGSGPNEPGVLPPMHPPLMPYPDEGGEMIPPPKDGGISL